MRSLQLQAALTELVEAAAAQLAAALAAGARGPLRARAARDAQRLAAPALYCYRALTGEFIAERQPRARAAAVLRRRRLSLLAGFEGSTAICEHRRGARAPRSARACPRRAAGRCCEEVFGEQTDFELRPERVRAGARAPRARGARGGEQTTLHRDPARPHDRLARDRADERPHDRPARGARRTARRRRSAPAATTAGHLIVALPPARATPPRRSRGVARS